MHVAAPKSFGFSRFTCLLAWCLTLAVLAIDAGGQADLARRLQGPASIALPDSGDPGAAVSTEPGTAGRCEWRFASACVALADIAPDPTGRAADGGMPTEAHDPWPERIKELRSGLAAAMPDDAWLRIAASAPWPQHAQLRRPPPLRPPRG